MQCNLYRLLLWFFMISGYFFLVEGQRSFDRFSRRIAIHDRRGIQKQTIKIEKVILGGNHFAENSVFTENAFGGSRVGLESRSAGDQFASAQASTGTFDNRFSHNDLMQLQNGLRNFFFRRFIRARHF